MSARADPLFLVDVFKNITFCDDEADLARCLNTANARS